LVVALKEESFEGTETKTFGIMAEAEADVEACIEERAQLLWLAAEAVKHPWHCGFLFSAQAQQAVEGFHAVDDEWLAEPFAQGDVLQEDFLLPFHRSPSQSIEPTFSNGKTAGCLS
jgi:hypothetical protein